MALMVSGLDSGLSNPVRASVGHCDVLTEGSDVFFWVKNLHPQVAFFGSIVLSHIFFRS